MQKFLNNKVINILLFCSIVFLCCCKKSNKLFDVRQQEARFSDIPIPINAKIITNNVNENSYAFQSNLDKSQMISFYENEMEKFGWNKITSFINNETLLIFEKPNRYISISIRPHGKDLNDIFILLASKK